MDHPFFGNWLPKNKNQMAQGARDFCNGKSLNAQSEKKDSLLEDFQEQKAKLKEMEKMMDPEDRKLMAQAIGADSSNSVADRFREAMKNIKK